METVHFQDKELKCRCGCGLQNVQESTLLKLEKARQILNRPIILTSASRCEKYNKIAGGKENSSHLIGRAIDISCPNSQQRYELSKVLLKVGFCRIGIGKTFIHCDNDKNKIQNVCWLY